ncbi:MAG: hypothetical protein H6737_17960 [Alphaproteobacteria bacterium]|nr:hypothetical protein [Alphaproteobacteria bacterium]
MGARLLAVGAWLAAAVLHGLVPRDPVALEPASAPVLAVLSGGHRTAAASAAWASTVAHFAATTPDPDALEAGIHTAIAFDPAFVPPVAQGSLMLRLAGAPERVPPLLEHGMAAHPGDPWFPWAMAMHVWTVEADHDAAAAWLDRAEALAPGGIHGEAADALRSRP